MFEEEHFDIPGGSIGKGKRLDKTTNYFAAVTTQEGDKESLY